MAITGTQYRSGEYVGIEYDWDGGNGQEFGGVAVAYADDETACNWLVQIVTEDGPASIDCGAPATTSPNGVWSCKAGHGYIPMDVRRALGVDYADDPIESDRLRAAGIAPIDTF